MARMTIGYGSAQVIGPAVAREFAALTGSYDAALWMAAALMICGLILLAACNRISPGRSG
jgi:hypothetical protein